MRLAIIGTRGVPANYGGFETFAQELSVRLATRGHDVTVYGRSHHVPRSLKEYRGVRLVVLPTLRHKYLDTVFHTFLAALHASFRRYDAVVMVNAANAIFCPILRLAGQRVILNVDGIERQRKKWNWLGKAYYQLGEWLATFCPNDIVSDARVIQRYYRDRYGRSSHFIPYGSDTHRRDSHATLDRYGLSPRQYVLYVSRLEPENNAHIVLKAFERVKTHRRLVIVGDAPYSAEYIQSLKQTQDARVLFTGFVYGEGYWELQSQAYCYIQATEVGGTHPALVEAMGVGGCVIANGTAENIEVVGEAGRIYARNSVDDLARQLQAVLADEAMAEQYRCAARERVARYYSWEAVTDAYERLLRAVVSEGKALADTAVTTANLALDRAPHLSGGPGAGSSDPQSHDAG
jgi:glycosyltransferase involved in cell wall biosynthesis